MARYTVFLETSNDGTTIAHPPDLPGCTIRAANRAQALAGLPQAIARHLAWLRRHGEVAPPADEPIDIAVSGESSGYGPFAPGDMAALLPGEATPITPEEMEPFFRLLHYSRADLLNLIQGLPDDLLDWQPDPSSWSIRRVLRHIGNAEEWYVSRIAAPETLPAEWQDDEHMPVGEFLDMERRTALDRLRRSSEAERGQVFHPTHWTDHPEEPWTARKVLRRFLEHEREHTEQVRQVLAARRQFLLAGLAAARGELLAQLVSLDEDILATVPVGGGWTVKEILAHLAGWDRWLRRELGRKVAGEEPDTSALRDFDAFNAVNVAAWKERPLDEVVAEVTAARNEWVTWMLQLPEEEFFRSRPMGRWDWCLPNWIEVFQHHDSDEHTPALRSWRESQPRSHRGPRSVLQAALAGRREELLAAAALVPPDRRDTLPVCGVWTLQDVLGHIADWENYAVAGLRDMAAGRQPAVPLVADEEAWNQEHAAARRGQTWETVWADFQDARAQLMDLLARMSPADLERPFPGIWEAETRPYTWFLVALEHDGEHAHDIREAMGIPNRSHRQTS